MFNPSPHTADHEARLLFDPFEMRYDFGEHHPMHPKRLQALMELLEASDLWHADCEQIRLYGRSATIDELQLVHSADYIAAIQQLSTVTDQSMGDAERRARAQLAERYGLDDGDTPAFPGMHDAARSIAGGTLVALNSIMEVSSTEGANIRHIFHPAGGWHHAQPDRASGFCIYNDIAVAIAHTITTREVKVAYIDFDAHHGDGVQNAFYDDPRVLKISLHETGRYLFPGTGDVLELGRGSGRGYSVNIPLEPFTEDDSYNEIMQMLLAPLLTAFGPDVLVTMHGCDTHAWDPLTHLHLSMRGIQAQARLAHQLSHTYCDGRWLAVGGGGYDPFRVVPRAWSLVWAEMAGLDVPEQLPQAWITRWQPVWQARKELESEELLLMGNDAISEHFPTTFMDSARDVPAQPRRDSISRQNRETAALVRSLTLPSSVRQAFPLARRVSPLTNLFDFLHANKRETPSRLKTLETPRGTVLLRDFCPPSLVERMQVEPGLCAFARNPEREKHLLLSIARSPDSALTVAHTSSGEIIGQVTLAPIEEWYEGLENAYEIAIEVSTNWRRSGIAKALLAFALELDALEDMLLFAQGLSWHWDCEGLAISPSRYRHLITTLFASQRFSEYATAEPDVAMEPENILLVRVGKRVDAHTIERFRRYLRRTPEKSRR